MKRFARADSGIPDAARRAEGREEGIESKKGKKEREGERKERLLTARKKDMI